MSIARFTLEQLRDLLTVTVNCATTSYHKSVSGITHLVTLQLVVTNKQPEPLAGLRLLINNVSLLLDSKGAYFLRMEWPDAPHAGWQEAFVYECDDVILKQLLLESLLCSTHTLKMISASLSYANPFDYVVTGRDGLGKSGYRLG